MENLATIFDSYDLGKAEGYVEALEKAKPLGIYLKAMLIDIDADELDKLDYLEDAMNAVRKWEKFK